MIKKDIILFMYAWPSAMIWNIDETQQSTFYSYSVDFLYHAPNKNSPAILHSIVITALKRTVPFNMAST